MNLHSISLHSSKDLQLTIGEALGTDYFGLREPFTPQQEGYLTLYLVPSSTPRSCL